jgi:hypothetical protein
MAGCEILFYNPFANRDAEVQVVAMLEFKHFQKCNSGAKHTNQPCPVPIVICGMPGEYALLSGRSLA